MLIQKKKTTFFFNPQSNPNYTFKRPRIKKNTLQDFLEAPWLRIHQVKQETQVRSLLQKIPHAAGRLSPCAAATARQRLLLALPPQLLRPERTQPALSTREATEM